MLSHIIDLLFPKYCIGCRKPGSYLCYGCQSVLKSYVNNNQSKEIFNDLSLDGLWNVVNYNDPNIEEIISLIKYKYVLDLMPVVDNLIFCKFNFIDDWEESFVLMPIPLHPRRFCARGFNQASLIADILAQKGGNMVDDTLLLRKVNNKPQAQLGAKRRRDNVNGIFKINSRFKGKIPEKIVLVDDVYTTGSTMNECARILKEAGVREVYGFVLARG